MWAATSEVMNVWSFVSTVNIHLNGMVPECRHLHLFSLYVSWDIYFLDLTSGFVDVRLLCLW